MIRGRVFTIDACIYVRLPGNSTSSASPDCVSGMAEALKAMLACDYWPHGQTDPELRSTEHAQTEPDCPVCAAIQAAREVLSKAGVE